MSMDVINYDKMYHSKLDGDYQIIKEVERNKFGHRQVLIKFINTGNEQIVEHQMAKREIVRDKQKREIDYDKVYQSNNFGPFKILRKLDYKRNKGNHILIEIEFIETGTIKEVRLADAMVGNIRDDYRPTIHGIACIGNGSSYHPAYNMWESMINRCYNINDNNYQRYGAEGVTVCKKWLCFEYFLEDLPYIDGYNEWLNNPGAYALDKDYKQMHLPKSEKTYSLETCCFLPYAENSRIAMFEHTDNYIGVKKINTGYESRIYINGDKVSLGIYPSDILAAAAYNNALSYFYPNAFVKNNVPNIEPTDLINSNQSPKIMCTIINSK